MRRARLAQPRSDAGETLIEILLTISIVGIVMVGLMSAMTLTVGGSDTHRRLTDSEIIARAYGEAIKNNVLHPVTTTLAAAIPDHEQTDSVTINVASGTAGFPAAPFYVQIDSEILQVKTVAGLVWTSPAAVGPVPPAPKGDGTHAAGTKVSLYVPCPIASDVAPTAFAFPTGVATAKFNAPSVSNVEFFDSSGTVSAAACTAPYYKRTASFCHTALNDGYFAFCDVPTIRATFTVTSKDVDQSRQVTTTSSITFRRGNA